MRRSRRTFTAVALLVAYGLEPQGDEDRYVGMLRELNAIGADVCVPGRYLVESLPFLQYLPSWIPGAGFKREIHTMKRRMRQITTELWQAGKAHLVSNAFYLRCPSMSLLCVNVGTRCRERLDFGYYRAERCAYGQRRGRRTRGNRCRYRHHRIHWSVTDLSVMHHPPSSSHAGLKLEPIQ